MKHFTLRGWHLYLSRVRLVKEERAKAYRKGRDGLARRMRELRNRRYRQTHGCCEACGQHCEKRSMQMHHLLPYIQFSHQARKPWNLLMLCPRCHFIVHSDLTWQMDLMQRVASDHGIDLRREFRKASEARWKAKEEQYHGQNDK